MDRLFSGAPFPASRGGEFFVVVAITVFPHCVERDEIIRNRIRGWNSA